MSGLVSGSVINTSLSHSTYSGKFTFNVKMSFTLFLIGSSTNWMPSNSALRNVFYRQTSVILVQEERIICIASFTLILLIEASSNMSPLSIHIRPCE